MPSVSKATILGHVGRDPETKVLPSGAPLATFSVATTERWTDKATGSREEHTTWHTVKAFDKKANFVMQYVTKGALVYVEGQLSSRTYTDRAGQERTTFEIKADQVELCRDAQSSARAAPDQPVRAAPRPAAPKASAPVLSAQGPLRKTADGDFEDDIPF